MSFQHPKKNIAGNIQVKKDLEFFKRNMFLHKCVVRGQFSNIFLNMFRINSIMVMDNEDIKRTCQRIVDDNDDDNYFNDLIKLSKNKF